MKNWSFLRRELHRYLVFCWFGPATGGWADLLASDDSYEEAVAIAKAYAYVHRPHKCVTQIIDTRSMKEVSTPLEETLRR